MRRLVSRLCGRAGTVAASQHAVSSTGAAPAPNFSASSATLVNAKVAPAEPVSASQGPAQEVAFRVSKGDEAQHREFSATDVAISFHPSEDADGLPKAGSAAGTGELESDWVQPVPSKFRFGLLLVGLGLAIFLAALDQNIVGTIQVKAADEFNDLGNAAWIGNAYFVTITAFLPLYGQLSSVFGPLTVLLFSIAVFEIGSVVCGAAQSMIMLILGRALAGVGGAGIIPMGLIIISDLVSERERSKYLGITSVAFGLSGVVGPLMGGAFAEYVTWRWAFYINLPLGLVSVAMCLLFVKPKKMKGSVKEKLKRIDYLGAASSIVSVTALTLALSFGGGAFAWNSALVISLFVVFALGLAVFVIAIVYIAPEPLIDPKMFKNRNVVILAIASFFTFVTLSVLSLFIPQYFAVVKGNTAILVGAQMLAYGMALNIFSVIAGFVMSKIGRVRQTLWVGTALMALGVGLVILWDVNTPQWECTVALIIAALGTGILLQPLIVGMHMSVAKKDAANATTLAIFIQLLGSTIGVALAAAVLNNYLQQAVQALPADLQVYKSALESAQALLALPSPAKEIYIQAYAGALRTIYVVMTPLLGANFVAMLFLKALSFK